MRTIIFVLFCLLANIGLQAQGSVNRLPKDLFGKESSAMKPQKAKPKNKKKSLGEHGVDVDGADNPALTRAAEALDAGNVSDAAEQFDQLDETNSEAAYGLAEALFLQDRYEDALEALKSANSSDDDTRFLLGLIYSDMGDFDKAESIFAAIIEENPADLDAWDALGWLYFAADLTEAAQTCKEVVLSMDSEYEMSY